VGDERLWHPEPAAGCARTVLSLLFSTKIKQQFKIVIGRSAQDERSASCLNEQARDARERTLRTEAQYRERKRHLGAVGLHEFPLERLRLALCRASGDHLTLRSELLQLHFHQAGVANPVA
jgi:hypothetical protein